MTTKNQKFKNKKHLRNNEYYNMQNEFDKLYEQSKNGKKFKNLLEIIESEQNIQLAYRNIKKNKGSKTAGTNNNTIMCIGKIKTDNLVQYVRNRLADYKPQPVRRVEIPKQNGKTRPLGIPTIEDRLIQQCIKQVLEPICEAKFHKDNYGFRPNRGTNHAIAMAMRFANINKLYHVVDIDIQGFFDNVDHSKLLKQIWSIGIQDKNLICIISKMLKAEIKGIGVSTKGVPQGGILSPLLANIVLNELDWWVSNQWYTIKLDKKYSVDWRPKALRNTKLKEVMLVRYCDDFKLFCRTHEQAVKMYHATKQWLKERLKLDVSEEKTKIVNLKTDYSEFLGFKLKVYKKSNRWVVKSHICDKSKEKIKVNIKSTIKELGRHRDRPRISKLNSVILGIHQYYKIATNVYIDFNKIAYGLTKSLKCRTKDFSSNTGIKGNAFKKFYGGYSGRVMYLKGIAIFPIHYVSTKPPLCFSQDICNYTPTGRAKIHANLQKINKNILIYIMNNPISNASEEFNDNRISLYVAQNGKCSVSGRPLQIGDMEVHHKIMKQKGGTDKYQNLIFVTKNIHKLIHITDENKINAYLQTENLNCEQLKKLNELRELVGNYKLV